MDIKALYEFIIEKVQFLINTPLPGWFLRATLVFAGLILFYFLIERIVATWTKTFAPYFYKPEEKRRSNKRKRFAEYVLREVIRLDSLEEWNDYRFADLEAEIEAEGRWISRHSLNPFRRVRTGLRREKSLSNALETSKDKVILLEGDPGSGKSIALRHLTQKLANDAKKSNSTKSLIPIYINLRGLEKKSASQINKQAIYDYILTALNRANDRDVEEFLEKEFDNGIEDGSWLFLFDSFDEIPDILSSTEADNIIGEYSEAINDFLQVMNQCRGIIASRYFRGPKHQQGPRFRIIPLSEKRQFTLIKNAELPLEQEKEIIGGLSLAQDEIRAMVSNPMFLGLLCEYIRSEKQFPENTYSVFEKYITTRLDRDQERLNRRYNLHPTEIRPLAESVAFCMTADQGLGLSPKRTNILEALIRQGFHTTSNFQKILDSLEYIKLARAENTNTTSEDRIFTFSHRRFQEYFATTVVLREPSRISPTDLITNARWRETCVTLCQTQPFDRINAITSEARSIIVQMAEEIKVEFHADWNNPSYETSFPRSFPWPSKMLHILGLLQEGFINRLDLLDEILRDFAGKMLVIANRRGNHLDKKYALEVARVSNEETFRFLISNALSSKSQWLRNTAYQQLSRVQEITDTVENWIRDMLLELALSGRIQQEQYATHSYLSRLPTPNYFLSIHNHLLWTIRSDIILIFISALIGIMDFASTLNPTGSSIIMDIITYFFLILFMSSFLFSPLLMWQNFLSKDSKSAVIYIRIGTGTLLFLLSLTSISSFNTFAAFIFIWGYTCVLSASAIELTRRTGKYSATKNRLWAPFILFFNITESFLEKSHLPKIHLPGILKGLLVFLRLILFIGIAVLIGTLLVYYPDQVNMTVTTIGNFIESTALYCVWGLTAIIVFALIVVIAKYIRLLINDSTERKKLLEIIAALRQALLTTPKFEMRRSMPDVYPTSFERLRFRRWRKKHNNDMSIYQFLDAISFVDIKYSFWALSYIREHRLLRLDLETEIVMEALVQHLEDSAYSRKTYDEDDESLINAPKGFVLWVLKYQRSFRYLGRLGIDFLDATSQFLEEIKKAQLKTGNL